MLGFTGDVGDQDEYLVASETIYYKYVVVSANIALGDWC